MDRRRPSPAEPDWLLRVLEWYGKGLDDVLVGAVELSGTQLEDIQRLWGAPPDDPMVLCYPVAETQRAYLEAHAGLTIHLDRFDYFVACYTRDWQATRRDGGYFGQFPPPIALQGRLDLRSIKPG